MKTKCLILRRIKDKDTIVYTSIFLTILVIISFITNLEKYEKAVEKCDTLHQNSKFYCWTMELNKNCKLGFVIGKKNSKKRLYEEKLTKVLEFRSDVVKCHQIEAEFVSGNDTSIRLVEKLRMQYETTRREFYYLNDKFYNQEVYVLLKKQELI